MPKRVGNYDLVLELGRGSFAHVYKGIHIVTGERFAVKTILRERIGDRRLQENLGTEIAIMRDIQHPNIVRLYDNFDTPKYIFLVLELCRGGDLSSFIKHASTKRLTEPVAQSFLKQLSNGLYFLNGQSIIHRDLKPANVLLSEASEYAVLKLADFGFAKHLAEASLAQTQCGSPLYMAPEILENQEYDSKADLWSVGCMFYEMLVGMTPFRGTSQRDLLNNILTKPLSVPSEISVSSNSIALLQQMLRVDPSQRATLQEFYDRCNATLIILQRSPQQQQQQSQVFRTSNDNTSSSSRSISGSYNTESFQQQQQQLNAIAYSPNYSNQLQQRSGKLSSSPLQIPLQQQTVQNALYATPRQPQQQQQYYNSYPSQQQQSLPHPYSSSSPSSSSKLQQQSFQQQKQQWSPSTSPYGNNNNNNNNNNYNNINTFMISNNSNKMASLNSAATTLLSLTATAGIPIVQSQQQQQQPRSRSNSIGSQHLISNNSYGNNNSNSAMIQRTSPQQQSPQQASYLQSYQQQSLSQQQQQRQYALMSRTLNDTLTNINNNNNTNNTASITNMSSINNNISNTAIPASWECNLVVSYVDDQDKHYIRNSRFTRSNSNGSASSNDTNNSSNSNNNNTMSSSPHKQQQQQSLYQNKLFSIERQNSGRSINNSTGSIGGSSGQQHQQPLAYSPSSSPSSYKTPTKMLMNYNNNNASDNAESNSYSLPPSTPSQSYRKSYMPTLDEGIATVYTNKNNDNANANNYRGDNDNDAANKDSTSSGGSKRSDDDDFVIIDTTTTTTAPVSLQQTLHPGRAEPPSPSSLPQSQHQQSSVSRSPSTVSQFLSYRPSPFTTKNNTTNNNTNSNNNNNNNNNATNHNNTSAPTVIVTVTERQRSPHNSSKMRSDSMTATAISPTTAAAPAIVLVVNAGPQPPLLQSQLPQQESDALNKTLFESRNNTTNNDSSKSSISGVNNNMRVNIDITSNRPLSPHSPPHYITRSQQLIPVDSTDDNNNNKNNNHSSSNYHSSSRRESYTGGGANIQLSQSPHSPYSQARSVSHTRSNSLDFSHNNNNNTSLSSSSPFSNSSFMHMLQMQNSTVTMDSRKGIATAGTAYYNYNNTNNSSSNKTMKSYHNTSVKNNSGSNDNDNNQSNVLKAVGKSTSVDGAYPTEQTSTPIVTKATTALSIDPYLLNILPQYNAMCDAVVLLTDISGSITQKALNKLFPMDTRKNTNDNIMEKTEVNSPPINSSTSFFLNDTLTSSSSILRESQSHSSQLLMLSPQSLQHIQQKLYDAICLYFYTLHKLQEIITSVNTLRIPSQTTSTTQKIPVVVIMKKNLLSWHTELTTRIQQCKGILSTHFSHNQGQSPLQQKSQQRQQSQVQNQSVPQAMLEVVADMSMRVMICEMTGQLDEACNVYPKILLLIETVKEAVTSKENNRNNRSSNVRDKFHPFQHHHQHQSNRSSNNHNNNFHMNSIDTGAYTQDTVDDELNLTKYLNAIETQYSDCQRKRQERIEELKSINCNNESFRSNDAVDTGMATGAADNMHVTATINDRTVTGMKGEKDEEEAEVKSIEHLEINDDDNTLSPPHSPSSSLPVKPILDHSDVTFVAFS